MYSSWIADVIYGECIISEVNLPSTHTATWDNENEADASKHRIWKTVKGIAFS